MFKERKEELRIIAKNIGDDKKLDNCKKSDMVLQAKCDFMYNAIYGVISC
jgi:hypothetical protein